MYIFSFWTLVSVKIKMVIFLPTLSPNLMSINPLACSPELLSHFGLAGNASFRYISERDFCEFLQGKMKLSVLSILYPFTLIIHMYGILRIKSSLVTSAFGNFRPG